MSPRKSRKNLSTENKNIVKNYRAAGYVRLSVVKEDDPGNSIETQTNLIQNFELNSDNIILKKLYIDNGASGASFERDALQEMLEDISKGEIDCVIVKDMSRFGRNVIEVGYYLQHYFPRKGVRFISIIDDFDTLDGITNTTATGGSGASIPLITMSDEEYTNTVSRQTQSTINLYIRMGKFVAPRAPYGYMKSPEDCHLLIPDDEAAEVVRGIFELAGNKIGLNETVRKLNDNKVLPPMEYAISKGLKGNYKRGNGHWNTRTVKEILENRTYVGDLIQGKDKHLVENTHEPIVSREHFKKVQALFLITSNSKDTKSKVAPSENILKGKIICGCCGGKMQRRKGSGNAAWHFFSCITNNRAGAGNCTGMYIRETEILQAMQTEVTKPAGEGNIALICFEKERDTLKQRSVFLNSELNFLQDNKMKDYENLKRGKISVGWFKRNNGVIEKLQGDIGSIENQLQELKIKIEKFSLFSDVKLGKVDIRPVVERYLEKVIVHENKSIIVEFAS